MFIYIYYLKRFVIKLLLNFSKFKISMISRFHSDSLTIRNDYYIFFSISRPVLMIIMIFDDSFLATLPMFFGFSSEFIQIRYFIMTLIKCANA